MRKEKWNKELHDKLTRCLFWEEISENFLKVMVTEVYTLFLSDLTTSFSFVIFCHV